MRIPSRQATRRQLLLLAAILLVLLIGLGWWSSLARRKGKPSPADALLLKVISLTMLPAGNTRNATTGDPETEVTKANLAHMQALEEENAKLRKLLNLAQAQPEPPVAAQIFGRSVTPWQGYLQAGAGKADGVRPRMVAITPDGIVGQVVTAAGNTANILPLTDTASGIGAKVVRMVTLSPTPAVDPVAEPPQPAKPVQRTQAVGVLKGYAPGKCPPGQCHLEYIADTTDVKVGDRVVTSGLGLVYGRLAPLGYPIGEVTAVKKNTTVSSLDITVKPYADPNTVEWVVLVK